MTRINCIPVTELTNAHLVAEYRELPRVFGLVERAIERGEQPNLREPASYVLGPGHVRFFYPRLYYCAMRFADLSSEMRRRGMKPNFTLERKRWQSIPPEWWNGWTPTAEAMQINRERIAERLAV